MSILFDSEPDTHELQPPFPWFGGKSRAAPLVWSALGNVANYVEPFAGSLAVLLARPSSHFQTPRIETVNDKDHYLSNFWRAVSFAPDEVAHWADWPINEDDLYSRHLWLVNEGGPRLTEGIETDPEYFDAKIAGWWVWGLCAWIGAGWCEAGHTGREKPHTGRGRGVHRKRPHLANAGRGIHRQSTIPSLEANELESADDLQAYMRALSERLRHVRVCTGDWQRVVTDGALAQGSTVGIFLDPPYNPKAGLDRVYNNHSDDVSSAVREWAIAHGEDPRRRIVLAGYEGEHEMPESWTMLTWKASTSYQTASGNGRNKENRHRERLWLSPACNRPLDLFSQE